MRKLELFFMLYRDSYLKNAWLILTMVHIIYLSNDLRLNQRKNVEITKESETQRVY